MDGGRFDELTRRLGAVVSRRTLAGLLAGGVSAGMLPLLDLEESAAKRKKKKKCKGGKKKCGKRCIPQTACCTDADCGACERCQGDQCISGCQSGQECQSRTCRCTVNSCAGCCDGDACKDGDSDDVCGRNGQTCAGCSGGKTCDGGICACAGNGKECGAGCCGDCQTCDHGRAVCIMQAGSDQAACSGGACCGGACCPVSCQCGVPRLSGSLASALAGYLGYPYPFCAAKGTGQSCDSTSCPAGTTCLHIPAGPFTVNVCAGACPGVDYPA